MPGLFELAGGLNKFACSPHRIFEPVGADDGAHPCSRPDRDEFNWGNRGNDSGIGDPGFDSSFRRRDVADQPAYYAKFPCRSGAWTGIPQRCASRIPDNDRHALLAHQQVHDRRCFERLEVHYLSNADDNLHFALLTDWLDATGENAANDEELLAAAANGISRLNSKYGPTDAGARFFLFHRKRVWNDGERTWMGWERKRGKLHELNQLLRGSSDTTFVRIGETDAELPSGVRNVITLDADTRMPIGVAGG